MERIRSLRYVHVPQASQLFEEACEEIERLRLTDDERAAIARAAKDARDFGYDDTAATLSGLLERMK